MPQKSKKKDGLVARRSVHLPEEVYENVCKLAKEQHTTPSAVMRSLITKGLTVAFIEDSEGLVRRIVHEEVKLIIDHTVERLVKLQLKSTKASASALYMLLVLLQNDYVGEASAQDLLANAFKQAAIYMRTKEKTNDEYAAEAKEFIEGAKTIGKKDDN